MDSTGDLPDNAAGQDDHGLPVGLPLVVDASTAARRLAATLLAHADDLASDDLATVSGAMAAVRSGARAVESALTDRGWGGGVLHGFGSTDEADPWDAGLAALLEEDTDEDLVDLADLADLDVLDDLDDGDDDPWEVPAGTKLTYQARWDFVVTDPEALLRHVERRAAELGQPWDRESILEHHPLFVLTELESFTARDLESAGLVFAGGQNVVHEVPLTLWELDDDARDDEFPTAIA